MSICRVEDCVSEVSPPGAPVRGARGLCRRHYVRELRHGDPLINQRDAAYRFWSKVDRVADTELCWLWRSSLSRDGYGRFYVDGRRSTRRRVQAHRFAYEDVVGPIPEGLTLDHLCRMRSCVNPYHLEPVTNRENIQRGVVIRAPSHCPQGHAYDTANTRFRPDGRRRCAECYRIRAHLRYMRLHPRDTSILPLVLR